MAQIKDQNNIRYTIDNFYKELSGVCISKPSVVFDCSKATQVKGFSLNTNQPAGTKIFVAFNTGSGWGNLSSSGTLSVFSQSEPDFDTLERFANTPDQLKAISSVPDFVGKSVRFAVGLYSPDPDNSIPSFSCSIKCTTGSQLLSVSDTSPEFELSENSQISGIEITPNSSGNASVNVTGRVRSNGSWSPWQSVQSLAGLSADAVQLQAVYSVQALNSGSAAISQAKIIYTNNSGKISGMASGEIVSLTEDWYMNVRQCRLTLKHQPLESANIRAFVAFRQQPAVILGENLGIGTGTRKTFQLKNVKGLKYDTVRVYYDGVRVYSGYEVNCEVGRVTCSAPDGAVVTCDYEHNWENELWHEMTLTQRQSLLDYDTSEFRFLLPKDNVSRSICAVKISLDMASGHINNEVLGLGTGKTQTYQLAHQVRDGRLTLTANSNAISNKNWRILDDAHFVKITAPLGQTIRASYDWISNSPLIWQFAAVFSE